MRLISYIPSVLTRRAYNEWYWYPLWQCCQQWFNDRSDKLQPGRVLHNNHTCAFSFSYRRSPWYWQGHNFTSVLVAVCNHSYLCGSLKSGHLWMLPLPEIDHTYNYVLCCRYTSLPSAKTWCRQVTVLEGLSVPLLTSNVSTILLFSLSMANLLISSLAALLWCA